MSEPVKLVFENNFNKFSNGVNYRKDPKTVDKLNRLPIHYALSQKHPNVGVIKALLDAYPYDELKKQITDISRHPLHYYLFKDGTDENIIELLIEKCRDEIQILDELNRLPIHYALLQKHPNVGVIKALLYAYPYDELKKQITDISRHPLKYYLTNNGTDENIIVLLTQYQGVTNGGSRKCKRRTKRRTKRL
jgi:deoxyinosine 3'endonuclease (endonuclease V)